MASAFPDDADQTLEHKLWQRGNRDLERSEFSVKGHLGSGRARTPARGSLPALGALCLDTLPARRHQPVRRRASHALIPGDHLSTYLPTRSPALPA